MIFAIKQKSRVLDELDAQLAGQEPTLPDLEKNLKYLAATIDESLRLNTPVPVVLKIAVNDDIWPDGTQILAGSAVLFSPYCQARETSVWGDDAGQFKPERWLVQSAPNAFKYPVFQAGPRICLGKSMALLEIRMLAALLLQRFDFEFVETGEPFSYAVTLTLPANRPLWMKVIPRLQ